MANSARVRSTLVFCCSILCLLPAAAQEPLDREMIAKIRDEGLQRSHALTLFDHLVNVVGPRLTATPAYKIAADWASERLKEWGLRDVRLDSWEFGRGWQLDGFVLEMTEPRYMPLQGYPEAWTPSTAGEIHAVPVYLGDSPVAEIEAQRERLRGAIVLSQPVQTGFIRTDRVQPTEESAPAQVERPAPTPGARADRNRINNALRGAAVILRTSGGEHGTMFVLGRDAGESATPTIVLSGEHYNLIARMLEHKIPVKLRVRIQSRYLEQDRNGYNVLADLPGRVPDEVVMIGAHLDSWHSATGATDNADGVTVAMEAMRILSAAAARPRRTIRLALWGGEEQGLLGSRRYVEKHLSGGENQKAREKLSVYFNIDPGSGPIYGFYLEGNDAVRPIFDTWLEPFRDIGARKNVTQGIGNTDHLSFLRAGIPGYNPVQDYVDYDVRTHHTNVDTYERVREADLRQAAVILASFAYHAANRPENMPRAPVK